MNRLQMLLNKLSEECCEVAQEAHKAAYFGLNERYTKHHLTNKERVHAELDDLMSIVSMLNQEFNFNYSPPSAEIVKRKGEKVNKYATYMVELGTLEE